MFFSNFRLFFLTALLGGLSSAAIAQGPDNNSQLTWTLPDSALQADTAIAVEMDGYDITAFANILDNRLVVTLDTPLAPGDHRVTILLFMANGDIETLLDDVVAVGEPQGTHWQVNATFDTHYRAGMKEKPEYQSTPHLGGTGAVDAYSQTRSGNWQVDTSVQAMYDSVSENNPDDDEWALAHYRVAATHLGQRINSGVAVGHIAIERNDLLFASYQRRGATAAIEQRDGDYQLQVFGLNSEPTTRYDGDLTVPEDASEKSAGAVASWAVAGDQLIVGAGYIDGEGTLGGAGFTDGGDPIVYGGQTWNTSVDSYWLNRSFWFHGEYAESEFDLDGIGIGEDEETDTAAQAFIKLSSEGDLNTAALDYWSLLLHYQTVGAAFYSMGNLYLPGDITMRRVFGQTSLKGLTLELEWAEEESNADDDPDLPTQTLKRHTLNLSYTPLDINPDTLAWRVLGMPSTYINYQLTTNSQPWSDSELVGYDLDNETELVAVGFQFAKERFNWEISHQVTWFDDRSDTLTQSGFLIYEPVSDTRNDLTQLQFSWVPGDRVSINLYAQWNKLVEEDTNNRYTNGNYGIDGVFQLIPQTLNLTMNYNQSRDRSDLSDSLFVEDNFTADVGNFQLNWIALQARDLTPGIRTYLRGSYGKQHNYALSDEQESWTAWVGLEIQWAAGGQP